MCVFFIRVCSQQDDFVLQQVGILPDILEIDDREIGISIDDESVVDFLFVWFLTHINAGCLIGQ